MSAVEPDGSKREVQDLKEEIGKLKDEIATKITENSKLLAQVDWFHKVTTSSLDPFLNDPMLQQSKAFMVIVLSRDNDGTNQTTSSSHVFYDHDVSDADRNNTIGPKEEDNRFLSLLGQKFHSSIFNVNKTWDGIENMCSIADLQEIMVKDGAPLFALTHACVTGQKQVPTRSE
jgi:hypothetical protein